MQQLLATPRISDETAKAPKATSATAADLDYSPVLATHIDPKIVSKPLDPGLILERALELNSRLLARILDDEQPLIVAVAEVERELLALAGCWRLFVRSPQGALARIGYDRIRSTQRRLEQRSCCVLEVERQRLVFADKAPRLAHWLSRAQTAQLKQCEPPVTRIELAQIVRADSRALGELRHQLIAARSAYQVERNLGQEATKAWRRIRAALAPGAALGQRLRGRRRLAMHAAQRELFRAQLSHDAARALWSQQTATVQMDRLVGLELLEQGTASLLVRGRALAAEQRQALNLLSRQRRACDKTIRRLLQLNSDAASHRRSDSAD